MDGFGRMITVRRVRRTMGVLATVVALAAATTAVGAAAPRSADTTTLRVGAAEVTSAGWLPWNNWGQEFVWNFTMQKLVTVAPDGTILPDLAESYEISDDGTEYTFRLSPDAMWHDGEPVTAADVAFTYNTTLKEAAGSNMIARVPVVGAEAVIADNSLDAEGIEVIDDHTIKFTFPEPSGALMLTTFHSIPIAPAHVFDGVPIEEYVDLPVARDLLIGSGPWRMVEHTVDQSVVLEAFDGYMRGRPQIDRVVVTIYADNNAQGAAAQAGDVDFTYIRAPSADLLSTLSNVDGYTMVPSEVGFFTYLTLNFDDPALADTRVRQAFMYALDRDVLNDQILGGINKVAVANGWLSPVSADLNTYDHDPERARELLADAGWDSDREVVALYESGAVRDDLPVIAEMLGEVGIKIRFESIDPAAVLSTIFENSEFEVWYGTGAGSLDGSPWLAADDILSTAIYPEGFNAMHYVSESFDEHFLAGQASVDPATAQAEFEAASLIFNEDLPFLPLYQRRDYTFLNANLRGPETATLLHPFAGGLEYWNWHFDD